jgi:hypothetical protein
MCVCMCERITPWKRLLISAIQIIINNIQQYFYFWIHLESDCNGDSKDIFGDSILANESIIKVNVLHWNKVGLVHVHYSSSHRNRNMWIRETKSAVELFTWFCLTSVPLLATLAFCKDYEIELHKKIIIRGSKKSGWGTIDIHYTWPLPQARFFTRLASFQSCMVSQRGQNYYFLFLFFKIIVLLFVKLSFICYRETQSITLLCLCKCK